MAIICYVCNEKTLSWQQNFTSLQLQHSKTAVSVALKHLLKDFQSVRNVDNASNAICGDCFSDLEHYDLMQVQVAQMQKKLRTVLLKTEEFHIQEAKRQNEHTEVVEVDSDENEDYDLIEVEDMIKEEIGSDGNDFDDGMVRINPEDVGENVANFIKDEIGSENSENEGSDLDQIAVELPPEPVVLQPMNIDKAIDPFAVQPKSTLDNRYSKCDLCTDGKQYQQTDLKGHILKHHMNDTADCEMCNSKHMKTSDLINHLKWHKKHPNTICRRLEDHEETPTKPKRIHKQSRTLTQGAVKGGNLKYSACELCTDGMQYGKTNLQKHIVNHHMKTDTSACEKCETLRKRPGRLLLHLKWHEDHPGYVCIICLYKANDKQSFIEHNELHKNIPNNVCGICRKSFKNRRRLKIHIISHNDRTRMCDVCGKVVSRLGFYQHKLLHEEKTPLKCDLCPKMFPNRSYLFNHKANVHREDRPFACSFCDMKFKRKDHCQVHEIRHQQDTKTLKCPVENCTAAYEHKFHLNQHIERKHGGSMPKGRMDA